MLAIAWKICWNFFYKTFNCLMSYPGLGFSSSFIFFMKISSNYFNKISQASKSFCWSPTHITFVNTLMNEKVLLTQDSFLSFWKSEFSTSLYRWENLFHTFTGLTIALSLGSTLFFGGLQGGRLCCSTQSSYSMHWWWWKWLLLRVSSLKCYKQHDPTISVIWWFIKFFQYFSWTWGS